MFTRSPRWYRGLPSWLTETLVVLVIVGAIALAIGITWRHSLAHAEARGRAALLNESHDWLTAANARWSAKLAASHAETAAKADTLSAALTASRRMSARIAALSARPDAPTVVVERDTAPVDTLPLTLRACGVQLDALALSCDDFRRSATATMAAQDSALRDASRTDSARAVQLAAIARSDSIKAVALAKRPTWWTVTKGAGLALGVGFLVGVVK